MKPRSCAYPGCNREGYGTKPLCTAHYKQKREGRKLKPIAKWAQAYTRETCSGPECNRFQVAKGLCRAHYNQLRAGVELKAIRFSERQEGKQCRRCNDNRSWSNGLCRKCYMNVRYKSLYSSPLENCEVCGEHKYHPSTGHDMCSWCYSRSATNFRKWDRQLIISALEAHLDKTGGIPPTAQQWSHATSEHPNNVTVYQYFSSWNELLELCGVEPSQGSTPDFNRPLECSVPHCRGIARALGLCWAHGWRHYNGGLKPDVPIHRRTTP